MNKRIGLLIYIFLFFVYPLFPEDEYIQRLYWHTYIRKINNEILQFPGTVGLVVKDFKTGTSYTFNADKKFVSASLIKIPIMTAVFNEFINGNISFAEQHSIKDDSRVSGSGILKYKPNGSKYTIYELVYTMIAKSDNTAAKILTELIGFDHMNKILRSIGMINTIITAKSFDLSDGEIAGDSYTTPRDIAYMLEQIYEKKLLRRYLSDQMIEIMKMTHDPKRLNKYLPKTFQLAHKTGLLRGACHDAGIVFSPKGDYLICILTDSKNNYPRAKQFIATIGRLTYDHLKKTPNN